MKLYRSLLGQFVEQQADTVVAVRASLGRRGPRFGRALDTLKGVSANLGAKALSGLAQVERSLRDRNAQSLEARPVSNMTSELARLMEAIAIFWRQASNHADFNLRSGENRNAAKAPQTDAGG